MAYASTDKTKLKMVELKIKRLLKIVWFRRRNESIEEIYELFKLLCKLLRKECKSTIVREAVINKNLNEIFNIS